MQSELMREDQSRSFHERQRPQRQEPLPLMPRSGRAEAQDVVGRGALDRRSDCPILLSSRLVLRAPHIDDVDALAHLANNANVATMVSRMPHPYTAADAAAFVRRTAEGTIGKCVYAITKAETGAFLGCCGVEAEQDAGAVELGFWLGEPHWNKGYATEAAQTLIDMAFRTREIERIDARCRVVNAASRRVLQKCGFQLRGSGLVDCLALGGMVPVEHFHLDRKTWISLRSWGGRR
ncbi:GNAT family N-acetyltransferase [Rhizobium sp. YIM 134829]|uniref:GNAT family N-acetyltransferase n=1 Tax=Rhizobium sp. YIM 134829 TaxID=3390453 RepID=UPI003978F064